MQILFAPLIALQSSFANCFCLWLCFVS